VIEDLELLLTVLSTERLDHPEVTRSRMSVLDRAATLNSEEATAEVVVEEASAHLQHPLGNKWGIKMYKMKKNDP